MSQKTKLCAVKYHKNFDTGVLLHKVAHILKQRSFNVAGVIQNYSKTERLARAPMHLVNLQSDAVFKISQDLGTQSRGCMLDYQKLADIEGVLSQAITQNVDLIIINKFGKAESKGGGLLSCIVDAICADIFVLTTVRAPYLEAWESFHEGSALELSPNEDIIAEWYSNQFSISQKAKRKTCT